MLTNADVCLSINKRRLLFTVRETQVACLGVCDERKFRVLFTRLEFHFPALLHLLTNYNTNGLGSK